MICFRFFNSNFFKVVGLLIASSCAWYLGYLFAEVLPENTVEMAMNNLQSIAEKPVVRAPPPKRQKCDHWVGCPDNTYAYRLLSGGGKDSYPKICFEDELLVGQKKNNAGRGMNMAIVNYATGKAVDTKVFDMYEGDFSGPMVKFINDAPTGSILLISTYDDGATKLTEDAKKTIEGLGCKDIRNIRFRSSWVCIGIKGVKFPSDLQKEKINHSDNNKNRYAGWPAEIQIEGCLPRDLK